MRAVHVARERIVQDIYHQGRFAGSRYAGDADELPQRNFYREVFQVIGFCADNGEIFSIAGAALAGDGNLQAARQVSAGQGLGTFHDVFQRPFRHDAPAIFTSAWAKVDDPICRCDGFLVMLNHQHRIPQVAQVLQGS